MQAVAFAVAGVVLAFAGYLFALLRKEKARTGALDEKVQELTDGWMRDRQRLRDVAEKSREERAQMEKDIAQIHRIATQRIDQPPKNPADAIREARDALEKGEAFVSALMFGDDEDKN